MKPFNNIKIPVSNKEEYETVMNALAEFGDKYDKNFTCSGFTPNLIDDFNEYRFILLGGIKHSPFKVQLCKSNCSAEIVSIKEFLEMIGSKKKYTDKITVCQEKVYKSTNGTFFRENMLCIHDVHKTPEGWREHVKRINKALRDHEKLTF